MAKIRICAVQFKASPDFESNIKRAEVFFRKAGKDKCDIICFPEVFLTGGLRKSYNPKTPAKSKKIFSHLSKKYKTYSIMGSIIEKINGKFYNISYLFDGNGKILGNYKKIHLVQKSEGKYLSAGSKAKVFRTKIGNIGIQICRDLLYPEVTRNLMIKGADIVFCPSFWCSKSSSYDWIYNNKYFKNRLPDEVTALASARAIESETVFVYINAAGKSSSGTLLGKTQIALPFYGTIAALNHNKEGIIIREVDLEIVRDAKKVYKIEKKI
ncbi:carbon-nitrogen hydrolase family protein [Candidatus Woesearchaeota archaeon]|nr:carbon-nitrogen hydrolase family protein [Candidatus Woesearchaeota archaeon]